LHGFKPTKANLQAVLEAKRKDLIFEPKVLHRGQN
jgi:hypothetical protein